MSEDAIDIRIIQQHLPGINCEYVNSIPSTQAAVKKDSLLIANHQTAGIGRRGNRWLTPVGRSICLSYRFMLPLAADQLAGYQMSVALAIVNSIKSYQQTAEIQLKWPNDLYHQSKKFAGILINLIPHAGNTEVIVGIGINWQLTPAQLNQVNQAVCNVPLLDKPQRTQYICTLLDQVNKQNQAFIQHGLSACLTAWEPLDYFANQTIQLVGEKTTYSGQYAGISGKGELMLLTKEGIKHFSSGEVSVKAL